MTENETRKYVLLGLLATQFTELTDIQDCIHIGQVLEIDGHRIDVLANTKPRPNYDSYGDAVAEEFYVVLGFEGKTFKIDGESDSYGSSSVRLDTIAEVQGKTKTVTVWEF